MADTTPRTLMTDPAALVAARARIVAGDPAIAPALDTLRTDVAAALAVVPLSVMDKPMLPPSGDRHDYMSIAPYWWPDPNRPDGLPYIRRDGETNPARERYDRTPFGALCAAVPTLALAWQLTGDAAAATHAAHLVRTWFLDPATRMNPHLQYGQAIHGITEGRAAGVIDTTRLPDVLDAVLLLEGTPGWTVMDRAGMVAWVRDYLTWLQESEIGRAEQAATNNHGTWYDVQVVSYARFAGEDAITREILEHSVPRRIAAQITPEGAQPRELERTLALHYSCFNLRAHCILATFAARSGVDLWRFHTADGRGLHTALRWLVAHACGPEPWPYAQIRPFDVMELLPLLRVGVRQYGDPACADALARLPADAVRRHRSTLLEPEHA